ncbi:type IVB secretion system protein IcmH/DotU [Sphingomonas sanxanigenens]|nr:type IVB secretion system protein IcmH/DotU [Sphingomonas sanxanigenens]
MSDGPNEMGGRTMLRPAGVPGSAPVPPLRPAPAATRPRTLADDDDVPQPPPPAAVRNALVTAATPLLALMAGMRAGRVRLPLPELHRIAIGLGDAFDAALTALPLDAETRRRARYGVLATADDIAQNLPGRAGEGAEWARRSLIVRAFGENIGGDRFWLLLDEMLHRPADSAALIELYHACLAAGFEGRYRVAPDGRRQLHDLMTRAYAALPHVRALSQTELSPRWRGTPTPMRRIGAWPPLLLGSAGALLLLVLAVLLLRLILAQTGQPALDALTAINPDQPLRLSRGAAPVAPADNAAGDRLRRFLAPEIAARLVTVEQDATSVRVRTTVGGLFASGSDALEARARPLFERIGTAIEAEPGRVRVEGHADSDAVATLTFPDNVVLSKARAEAAGALIRSRLSAPDRVTVEGFGASRPITTNDSPAGKALNRRVEVVLVQEATR